MSQALHGRIGTRGVVWTSTVTMKVSASVSGRASDAHHHALKAEPLSHSRVLVDGLQARRVTPLVGTMKSLTQATPSALHQTGRTRLTLMLWTETGTRLRTYRTTWRRCLRIPTVCVTSMRSTKKTASICQSVDTGTETQASFERSSPSATETLVRCWAIGTQRRAHGSASIRLTARDAPTKTLRSLDTPLLSLTRWKWKSSLA